MHREHALVQSLHVAEERLDRLVVAARGRRQDAHARAYVRVNLRPLDDAHAVGSVDDELQAFGAAHHALDHDERADLVEVCGRRGLALWAASTAATERGLPAASGMTVPGKSVVCCKGSTAISKTSPLPAVSSAISVTICGDSGSTGRAGSSAPCVVGSPAPC